MGITYAPTVYPEGSIPHDVADVDNMIKRLIAAMKEKKMMFDDEKIRIMISDSWPGWIKEFIDNDSRCIRVSSFGERLKEHEGP